MLKISAKIEIYLISILIFMHKLCFTQPKPEALAGKNFPENKSTQFNKNKPNMNPTKYLVIPKYTVNYKMFIKLRFI